jgi:hypothetical protein
MDGRYTILLSLVVLVAVFAASPAAGDEIPGIDAGDWEAGIILGEPTGFSMKFWTTWNTGLDIGLAWSFGDNGHVHLHADYLFHNFNVFEIDEGDLPVYFGIGGRVRLEDDDSRVGLRIPIGMEYILADTPLSFFFELVPIVDFAPETEGSFNGGLGVRYIF